MRGTSDAAGEKKGSFNMEIERYKQYIDILREELIPAMGCTEPIALAYAAAVGRQVLGCLPERILARVSSNIIKNVKSVVVPNTGGLRDIPAAVAAGAVAGDSGKKLEVISRVTAAQIAAIRAYLAENRISVENIMSGFVFDIELRMEAGADNVLVRIVGNHTNIVQLVHNGKKLIDLPVTEQKNENRTDRSILSVAQILEKRDRTADLMTARVASVGSRQNEQKIQEKKMRIYEQIHAA